MPKYLYQAYTKSREKKSGVIDAENRTQALAKLHEFSLYPIKITVVDHEKLSATSLKGVGKISSLDIAIFTRQVANLLDAGLTILAALVLVAKQTWKPALKVIIDQLVGDLKEGDTFSQALGRHPRLFSGLYVSLIRSAEAGGFLREVTLRLADFLEEEEDLKGRVSSAMVYPLLIAGVGVLTIYALLSFVIPKLVLVFEDFDQALPAPTQALIDISSFVSTYWWIVALGIIVVVFILNRIMRTSEGKLFFDRLKLKIPVLRSIILKTQMGRFCRILSTLLGNGVTILPSLEIVGNVIDNAVLQREIEATRIEVRDGASLSKAVGKAKHFPADIVNIIGVGEESGNLEKVLKKVSVNYERQVERSIKTFISLLEPLMILVMGSIVAFIVIAMLLPIFQINFMAR